jgi:hypothetical protein
MINVDREKICHNFPLKIDEGPFRFRLLSCVHICTKYSSSLVSNILTTESCVGYFSAYNLQRKLFRVD